jgi:hypothetical protein
MFKDGQTNVHHEEGSGQLLFTEKDGTSQFQKFRMNFHKFHALFSMRLSQLGYASKNFWKDGLQKCSWVHTKCKEWLWF